MSSCRECGSVAIGYHFLVGEDYWCCRCLPNYVKTLEHQLSDTEDKLVKAERLCSADESELARLLAHTEQYLAATEVKLARTEYWRDKNKEMLWEAIDILNDCEYNMSELWVNWKKRAEAITSA